MLHSHLLSGRRRYMHLNASRMPPRAAPVRLPTRAPSTSTMSRWAKTPEVCGGHARQLLAPLRNACLRLYHGQGWPGQPFRQTWHRSFITFSGNQPSRLVTRKMRESLVGRRWSRRFARRGYWSRTAALTLTAPAFSKLRVIVTCSPAWSTRFKPINMMCMPPG
jgi:hypothetical protein